MAWKMHWKDVPLWLASLLFRHVILGLAECKTQPVSVRAVRQLFDYSCRKGAVARVINCLLASLGLCAHTRSSRRALEGWRQEFYSCLISYCALFFLKERTGLEYQLSGRRSNQTAFLNGDTIVSVWGKVLCSPASVYWFRRVQNWADV